MRICSVKDLKSGDVLGKSIYLPNRKLLLGAGYRITDTIKAKLIEKNFSHVYIMEEGTEDVIPEDVISEEIKLEARQKLSDKVEQVKEAMEFKEMSYSRIVNSLEKGNLKYIEINYEIRSLIREIIEEISATGVKYMNTIMIKSKDNFFYDHAINTVVMAILIGKRYKFLKEDLISLATGSFLHDIGKVIIDQLKKKDKKEGNYYKEHPTFGYLLLRNDTNITPLVLQTVNQHHEQQDGNGFPIGLKGDNTPPVKADTQKKGDIFRFAEVCSVANAYDRKLLNPLEKDKMTPQGVIKEIINSAGTVYNKSVVDVLTQVVAVYPVGSFVKINYIVDPSLIGCFGVVAKINEDDLKKPTIIITTNKYKKKIKPIIIDTSKLTRVDLKLII